VGKHVNATGDITHEGSWEANVRDGEGSFVHSTSAPIKIFWRDGKMEMPSYVVLPPALPAIKEIRFG
jgi:hypothetical protein